MPVLPFLATGELRHQDGTVIASDVPVSVWPASGRSTEVGRAYDHTGEAPMLYSTQLREANLRLVVDDTTYIVVQATAHSLLPHVALLLRESRSA